MYNIYYSIGSFLFLLVIMISYLLQKKIHNKKDIIYSHVMVASMVAVLFDAVAVYFEDNYRTILPTFLFYIFNMLFLLGMHTFLILLVKYFLELTGIKLKKIYSFLIAIPYIALIILLCLCPFTKFSIFYINEENRYTTADLHFMLYVFTIYYLIVYLIIIY